MYIGRNIALVILVLLGVCTHSLYAQSDLNRCGAIQDDRTTYTAFDSSNGHNILEVKVINTHSHIYVACTQT